MIVLFLPSLSSMVLEATKISNTTLKRSDNNGYLLLVPDLKENICYYY